MPSLRQSKRNYFNVNPNRFKINKAHYLPQLVLNPYTHQPNIRALHCKFVNTKDMSTFDLENKQETRRNVIKLKNNQRNCW